MPPVCWSQHTGGMSTSGTPADRVRAIEDDFADAMTRMYRVGNDLARLRASLVAEAETPAEWTPVAAPTPAPAAAPAPAPVAAPAPAPAPSPAGAPGVVTPPPTAPSAPPAEPPTAALPPTEPWWQRDGVVAKLLAVVGTGITLIGVAFLLALAIQMGFFGPLARVISGAILAAALVSAAVLVRRRPSGTIGALGLAATGFATAYLDVLAVTYVYAWVPLPVGMALAGAIALGGVLLARAWESELLAVVAVLGVALMAPFVGISHGLLTGAFLVVLAAATWPAQVGRSWYALEVSRVVPAALFLMVLAGFHERTGIAATLAVVLAVLLTATAALGATVRRLPEQLGILLPVAIAPAAVAALAVDDRWGGAGLFVVITCLLVIVAVLADHGPQTPWYLRQPEIALVTAGVTSLGAALRAGDGQGWTPVIAVAVALGWAVAALFLRHQTTLVVALAFAALSLLGGITLLPYVLGRGLAGDVDAQHLIAAGGLLVLYAVLARAITTTLPMLAPALPRVLVALSLAWAGGVVVLAGALLGQLLDDARGGFMGGQAGATVIWMGVAAVLLLRGLRGSSIAIPAGLTLVAASVAKLLLFDLSFLSGIARVLCFIVAGLLLLGMGAGYAQALERTRREKRPPAGPVENPTAAGPLPPTV